MNHTHPEPERHNLRLIGDGLTNGGAFGKVKIDGRYGIQRKRRLPILQMHRKCGRGRKPQGR